MAMFPIRLGMLALLGVIAKKSATR